MFNFFPDLECLVFTLVCSIHFKQLDKTFFFILPTNECDSSEAEVKVWEWHWEMHPYVIYCTAEISLTTLLSFLVSSWKTQRGFHIFNQVLSMQKCMFGHISKKSGNLFKM